MFLTIAAGYMVRRSGWVSALEVKHFNKVVFHTFMPAMLFWSIYSSDFSKLLRFEHVAFACVGVFITFLIALFIVSPIEKDGSKRGAIIHAAYRSNFLLLGTPMVEALMPGSDVGVVAVISGITIPLYTILAVIMLEYYRSGSFKLGGMAKSLIKNPLILASIAGIAVKAAGIQLPFVVETFVSKMNSATSSVALLVLGMALEWKGIVGERRDLAIAVALRLVVFPAIMLTAAALMGFRGMEFVVLIPLFASPTAVNTFNMAQEMGADLNIAGGALVVSTVLSSITLFCWISLFNYLGMF